MTVNELIQKLQDVTEKYGDDEIYIYLDGSISGYIETAKVRFDDDPDPEARFHAVYSAPMRVVEAK